MSVVGFSRVVRGAIVSPAPASPVPTDVVRWSDLATWGGALPRVHDVVRVPAGSTLLVDQNVDVGAIEVMGTLLFAPRHITVRARGILVAGPGILRAGDVDRPFVHRLVFTLSGGADRDMIGGLGSQFLAAVDGGSIELFGRRRPGWVALGDTVVSGAIVLRMNESVDWSPGDRIAIASGGADLPLLEERSVFSVTTDGLRVTLDAPVQNKHLGHNARAHGARSTSVAKVVLLSRSIVIEGDMRSTRGGYGAHVMVAGHAPGAPGTDPAGGSRGCFVGVEFRRGGQWNYPGRYPVHWFQNPDPRGSLLADCVIHQSYQRGVVATGTRGLRLHGNVVYKPLGHGFIVDQSDDSAAVVTTNLVVRPRPARFADPSMRALHERQPRSVWFADTAPAAQGVTDSDDRDDIDHRDHRDDFPGIDDPPRGR